MEPYLALQVSYNSLLTACCLIAFRFGGRPERYGAAVILVGSLTCWLIEVSPWFDWRTSRNGLFVVDALVFVAFMVQALRSERFWPLWISALQLIAVTTHLAMLLQPHRVLQAYAIAQGVWAYPMLIAIAVLSIRAHRRRLSDLILATMPQETSDESPRPPR